MSMRPVYREMPRSRHLEDAVPKFRQLPVDLIGPCIDRSREEDKPILVFSRRDLDGGAISLHESPLLFDRPCQGSHPTYLLARSTGVNIIFEAA